MFACRHLWFVFLVGLVPTSLTLSAEPANGWRGNGTGLWPDSKPPLTWHRLPRGAMETLRCTANKPAGTEPGDAPRVVKGLMRNWLVLGPFAVEDSSKDFDKDFIGNEGTIEPSLGTKTAEKEWKAATVPPDDIMVFGTAELPWLDLAKAIGYARNQVAYAHTYLYSPRGGPAQIVADHAQGMKMWVNGHEVYRSAERRMQLGFYPGISKYELTHLYAPSPKIELELKPGWNRLLVKLSTSHQEGYTDMRCNLRLSDAPEVKYDEQNILWKTRLPNRSTSTPIIVGERLFVMSEPDELTCLDKNSGQILWSATINYFEALTPEERKAQPAFAERVDPLVAALRRETDPAARLKLRGSIQQILIDLDAPNFNIKANDHFEAHFGIVGLTMPTPVSDGEHVYVWSGLGVAACFDLAGKREWISRMDTGELSYGSSPALSEGILVTFMGRLFGIDAKTGKLLWEQPKVKYNIASLLAAKFNGEPVVVTQRGDVVRSRDGEMLFRPQGSNGPGDIGWSPPVILGQTAYVPKYGVSEVSIFDFSEATGKAWQPKLVSTVAMTQEFLHPKGEKWIDRWTAGSPLIWQGISYQCDIYQTLYAVDIKSGRVLYKQELDLEGYTHYNAVAVAASPTLVGNHIFVLDNQGTTVVIEPGEKFKQVARNRIATQVDRQWPLPAQETLSYSPPIADGNRLYLRGEAYLYCIGEK